MFEVFTVLVVIVLIVRLVSQDSRISRLEKKVDASIKSPQAFAGPATTAQTVQPAAAVSSQQKLASSIDGQIVGAVSVTPTTDVIDSARDTEEKTGRLLGSVGIFAVFIGAAFFLKYAFDNNWIGVTGRVMLGVVTGVLLLGIGQYLRKKYLKYSDLLMGGGIGILYLSIFSAYSFYHLISSPIAFILMASITVLAMVVSIINATVTLSIIGVLGGFLTPTLVGGDVNNMFGLMAYLTILNLGILGISTFKKWQPLVYLGAIGTLADFFLWYIKYYNETELWGTFAFAFITFLIFIWASVARNVIAKIKADGADFLLLSANAAAFSLLSYTILAKDYHAYLGFGAVVIAAIYLVIANFANKFNAEDRALNFFLSGTGALFLTLAVPLQFDGSWITVAWIVESLLIYCTASFVQNRGFQIMGATVFFIGMVRFFAYDAFTLPLNEFVPIFNKVFWLALLAIIIAYSIAYIYKKYGSTTIEIARNGIIAFVLVANVLSILILTQQITLYYKKAIVAETATRSDEIQKCSQMYNGDEQGYRNCSAGVRSSADSTQSLQNTSNTAVSILWALYAAILVILGFIRRIAAVRRLGLVLFGITALKVFFDVWSLGQLYRIVSSISFGVIALGASFLYAKFKDRLKQII